MNRPAIDDLLGSILSTWYESVAEWMPPGQLSATTCTTCTSTALACAVDVWRWPHDLTHQLGLMLEGAIVTITESLEFELHAGVTRGSVRAFVISELTARRAEVEDVLEQCVTPRLDDWISSQAMSLTPHLRG